ncbi:3-phosphoshikimate 1-carboxyvinyltransferase [Clostridium bornimense]|uniref:3-phosphoshikimate 1-carboxyvinyltransferase n=1 Tax=Clostridium bornimense TaxID=1216932 RepID=UPI001C120E59|nr:3-phosphoshikimate 1-carboxyvinyltransferase [Clostridium bornimense]MBU5317531.1 3-phosphoshikimate 1-carboxyvinyltransferase [Clostridium bornimense]
MKYNYIVNKFNKCERIEVVVPGSKSITNRAFMLAALSNGSCRLEGVLFSDDSRAFLSCLVELGFEVKIDEDKKEVIIYGLGGRIPNKDAKINVRSAGTAARFLTAMVAFAGGNYLIESSDQMKKRPMRQLVEALRSVGVIVNCLDEEGHFPLQIHSNGIKCNEIEMDTTVSSQFVSALLMAGIMLPQGLKLKIVGSRTDGAYIKLTLSMMKQFGIDVICDKNEFYIPHNLSYKRVNYKIEPDVSGACYFYAMSPLLGVDVVVKNIHLDSIQGDIKFLDVLKQLGCSMKDTNIGIEVKGPRDGIYHGVTVDMNDFSDQTMTLAAIAPFATSNTIIKNISHIRFQETDRIAAIINELTNLGVTCRESENCNGIYIEPGKISPGVVETYDDHRMAMAFTLIGLRTGGITIKNYKCCGKTFENYFDIIDKLTIK